MKQFSEIQGFDSTSQTQPTTKDANLRIMDNANKFEKEIIKEEKVLCEEGTLDTNGKFQLIGVNFTRDFNKFLSENSASKGALGIHRYDLASVLSKTQFIRDRAHKNRESVLDTSYEIASGLLSQDFDTYYLKWLEHEDWKTFSLINHVKFKSSNMISKRFMRSLRSSTTSKTLMTVLDYLLCMESPEVFAAYYKLTRSDLIRTYESKIMDRRLRNFTLSYARYTGDKKEVFPAVDSNGEGISRNVMNLLYNLRKDAKKLSCYFYNREYVVKYITQQCAKRDYEAADNIYRSYIKDKKMNNFNIPFYRNHEIILQKQVTYEQYLSEVDAGFMDFIKAKQAYLQQGLLAMTVDYTYSNNSKGYDEAIIQCEEGSMINPYYKKFSDKLNLTAPALDGIIYTLSRSGISPTEVTRILHQSIEEMTELIEIIHSNNIKLRTKNLLYTTKTADANGKKHYTTTTYPHAKSPFLNLDDLDLLKVVLYALDSRIVK